MFKYSRVFQHYIRAIGNKSGFGYDKLIPRYLKIIGQVTNTQMAFLFVILKPADQNISIVSFCDGWVKNIFI